MSPARAAGRPRIVVVSTFPVFPRVFGGQLRAFHLARELSRDADVRIVSLTEPDERDGTVILGPGLSETTVARSPLHAAVGRRLARSVGTPVGDLLADAADRYTPKYGEVLAEALDGASALVLAHPYLVRVARRRAPRLPLVYDAHNAEVRHKQETFEGHGADRLVELVRELERAACEQASLVSAPTERDLEALVEVHGLRPDRGLVVPNAAAATEAVLGATRRRRRAAWLRTMAELRSWHPWTRLALFVGSHHPPNVDALGWVTTWARARPRIAVVVAGAVSEALDPQTTPENVLGVGWIDDTIKDALLAAADLDLNPVRLGFGSNVKVPEALMAGVPLVTTPVGARGYDLVDGRDAVVRDLPDLAAAADALLGDDTLADAIAARAAESARQYSWGVVAAPWRQRVLEIAA